MAFSVKKHGGIQPMQLPLKKRLEKAALACRAKKVLKQSVFVYVYRAAFQDALVFAQMDTPCVDAMFVYTFIMRIRHFLKRPRHRLLVAAQHTYMKSNASMSQYLTNFVALDRDLQSHYVAKRVDALVNQCEWCLLYSFTSMATIMRGTELAHAVMKGQSEEYWQSLVGKAFSQFWMRMTLTIGKSARTQEEQLLTLLETGMVTYFQSSEFLSIITSIVDELIAYLVD